MSFKMRPYLGWSFVLVSLWLVLIPRFVFGTEEGVKYAEQATRFLLEGKDFQAVLSYRRAIREGLKDPSVLRNMALAFYNLRMLDEAIENMEASVEARPKDPNMLTELGILYGAKGDHQKAISALQESLQLDPGQGDAYLYLGLALMSQGQAKLAWQAARIAEKLHQNPVLLVEKLQRLGEPEPLRYPFQAPGNPIALRQIVLDSTKQGEELVAKWRRGESLAELFQGVPVADGRTVGGYIGVFTENELKPEILTAISDSNIYDQPVIVNNDNAYLLVQRIWAFDPVYWAESGQKKIEPEHTPVAVSDAFNELPTQVEGKAAFGNEDLYNLGEVDPRKILLYTGSFHQKEYAIEQIMNLRDQRFSAYYLEDRGKDGRVLYNVIAGAYSSREEVLKAREQLREKGFESFFSGK